MHSSAQRRAISGSDLRIDPLLVAETSAGEYARSDAGEENVIHLGSALVLDDMLPPSSVTSEGTENTLSPDDNKAVQGFNLGDLFNKFSGLFSGISILTWIVGTGTLLAGIVGVSNIMLVTVRERTQEIGIRRALGAKPRTIISQIMSESFVLTFVSGIFGLALAIGILSLAETLLSSLTAPPEGGGLQINTQISFGLALGSTGILILGSLLAGILPANRALSIKPVDAIREE